MVHQNQKKWLYGFIVKVTILRVWLISKGKTIVYLFPSALSAGIQYRVEGRNWPKYNWVFLIH
jgi:hypothetical protein